MVLEKHKKQVPSTVAMAGDSKRAMAWNSDISPIERPLLGKWFCCMMPVITSSATTSQGDPGLQRLISSLDSLKTKVNGSDLDLSFLRDLLEADDFQSLLKVHQKVTTPEAQDKKAMAENALQVTCEICSDHQRSSVDEARELVSLLNKPHMRGLLHAHDQVASGRFSPSLPDIPHEVDEDEESVKVIRLVKGNNEPLGATIQLNEETGAIQIARVLHGGAADRSGLIHVGDEVHEVNGISVRGKEPDEIVQTLTNTLGPITLKLVPGDTDCSLYRESKMRVRAHFSYDPSSDKLIPCPEAGLSFNKGDILHIVSQDDPNWWQARKEGDRNMRAGLIPGRTLQERKEALRSTTGGSVESSPKSNKSPRIARFSPKLNKKSKKTKKIMYQAQQDNEYDTEEVVTYEEVERLYPKVGRHRPVVLIGPPGVGRNELKRRLIASNPCHFKSTVPHTSRPRKSTEIDGEEYTFISREDMEKDIQSKRYVEHGEYKGNLYGTSVESVKSIMNAGQVCVFCPHPQALKILRTAEFKTFVVFIKPPPLDRLKATRGEKNAKSTFDEKNSRPFTDEEFSEMLAASVRLETIYGHHFDATITNDDLQTAANELRHLVTSMETEPLWVPASWVR